MEMSNPEATWINHGSNVPVLHLNDDYVSPITINDKHYIQISGNEISSTSVREEESRIQHYD